MRPDIASIQECVTSYCRSELLSQVRAKTGLDYALSSDSPSQWWDGDILYRNDKWGVVADGVVLYSGSRGMSWARLESRLEAGRQLLVYGVHPIAGGSEMWSMHLANQVRGEGWNQPNL